MKSGRVPKEFLGAFKCGHRKSAREFIDDELSYELLKKVIKHDDPAAREALEFITKFNNEFHKAVVKKGDENALHSTDVLRKDCYSKGNSRNRDIYTKAELVYVNFNTLPMNPQSEDYPYQDVPQKEHSNDRVPIYSNQAQDQIQRETQAGPGRIKPSKRP